MPVVGNDIIPSFLGISQATIQHFDGNVNSNMYLRIGEVQKIVFPNDPTSRSKQFVEYNVYVQHMENNTYVNKMYSNCMLINTFGGQADKCVFTLRANEGAITDKTVGLGSKVVILCINGASANPLIIGGVRNQQDKSEVNDVKGDPGHHFLWNFNGIEATINKDGELSLTYEGATNADGTLADSVDKDAVGTFANFQKNGNLELSTPKEDQTFILNHEDKTIETKANEGWSIQVDNGLSTIKSQGLHVGEATDAPVLGTTYRKSQAQLHAELSEQITALTTLLTTASTSFTAALIPLVIPIVGNTLAVPVLIPFATALAGMIPVVEAMGQAIADFEAESEEYLSKVNLSD
jgi:hypothetical protein